MKKFLIIFILLFFTLNISNSFAHSHYHYRYSHHSSTPYVVGSDFFQKEQYFPNYDKHYLLIDTTVYYYSNGSRRTYNSYSIIDKNGVALVSNCKDIKHGVYNNKHYFLVKKDKFYQIVLPNGEKRNKRNYSKMEEIEPNKLLVCVNKMYGIVDLEENIIVPIKYKSFEKLTNKLYKTKIGKYYGLIDISNNIYLENEYDKIKPLFDTFVIKKDDKYGLISLEGNVLLATEYDKIQKEGEFIIVKKDKKYGAFNYQGENILPVEYKKIKLKRNQLETL